jgi:hypothetical protein
VIAAWLEYEKYNCAKCTEKTKYLNGCVDVPRESNGSEVELAFPLDESMWVSGEPEYRLDTCPMNVLSEHSDVQEIFRAANISGVAPLGQQTELPMPYIEALSVVLYHRDAAGAWKMKVRAAEGRKAKRHGRK